MLVLSRHSYERILIGDDIIIEVVQIQDGRVRLGIVAPSSVTVHREEVAQDIARRQAEEQDR